MLTAEEVYNAFLSNDAAFARLFPEEGVRAAYREMIEASVPLLGSLPDQPATLKTFSETRLIFIKQVKETKLIEKVIAALSDERCDSMGGRATLLESTLAKQEQVLTRLEQATANIAGLHDGTVTEEVLEVAALFLKMGMQADSDLTANKLTIGQYLLLRPAVFFAAN